MRSNSYNKFVRSFLIFMTAILFSQVLFAFRVDIVVAAGPSSGGNAQSTPGLPTTGPFTPISDMKSSLSSSLGTVPVLDTSAIKQLNVIGGKIDNTNESLGFVKEKTVLGKVAKLVTLTEQLKELRESLSAVCMKTMDVLDSSGGVKAILDASTTNPSFWLSVIGGGAAEATMAQSKIVLISGQIKCVEENLKALENLEPRDLKEAQYLQNMITSRTSALQTLKRRQDELVAIASTGWKDVVKAMMVRTILTINKDLSTKLVNEMIKKYKIDDYLAYGDVLGTQVYSMKYINENYKGNPKTQMMLRSIIQSKKFPEKGKVARLMASQEAKSYLSSACSGVKEIKANDKASMDCLVKLGEPTTDRLFQIMGADAAAAAAEREGKSKADQEISQSDGYAPARDCSGSVTQQAKIDSEYEIAVKEEAAAGEVFGRVEALGYEMKVSQEDVAKAAEIYQAKRAKLRELQKNTDSPVIDICKAIVSPASFVSKQLNGILERHLEQGSQLKGENLPFFAKFFSDMTSNLILNVLTGKKNSQVLKEAGLTAMGLAIGDLPSLVNEATKKKTSGPTSGGGDGEYKSCRPDQADLDCDDYLLGVDDQMSGGSGGSNTGSGQSNSGTGETGCTLPTPNDANCDGYDDNEDRGDVGGVSTVWFEPRGPKFAPR